jgi:hypothetical protein
MPHPACGKRGWRRACRSCGARPGPPCPAPACRPCRSSCRRRLVAQQDAPDAEGARPGQLLRQPATDERDGRGRRAALSRGGTARAAIDRARGGELAHAAVPYGSAPARAPGADSRRRMGSDVLGPWQVPRADCGLTLGGPVHHGMRREFLESPIGLPCSSSPWGTLAAVDLAAGRVRRQFRTTTP